MSGNEDSPVVGVAIQAGLRDVEESVRAQLKKEDQTITDSEDELLSELLEDEDVEVEVETGVSELVATTARLNKINEDWEKRKQDNSVGASVPVAEGSASDDSVQSSSSFLDAIQDRGIDANAEDVEADADVDVVDEFSDEDSIVLSEEDLFDAEIPNVELVEDDVQAYSVTKSTEDDLSANNPIFSSEIEETEVEKNENLGGNGDFGRMEDYHNLNTEIGEEGGAGQEPQESFVDRVKVFFSSNAGQMVLVGLLILALFIGIFYFAIKPILFGSNNQQAPIENTSDFFINSEIGVNSLEETVVAKGVMPSDEIMDTQPNNESASVEVEKYEDSNIVDEPKLIIRPLDSSLKKVPETDMSNQFAALSKEESDSLRGSIGNNTDAIYAVVNKMQGFQTALRAINDEVKIIRQLSDRQTQTIVANTQQIADLVKRFEASRANPVTVSVPVTSTPKLAKASAAKRSPAPQRKIRYKVLVSRPGLAFVRSKRTGEPVRIEVGDNLIGYGRVISIDAYSRIMTKSGLVEVL